MQFGMHVANSWDVLVAMACSAVGIYCFTRGFELWQGRNDWRDERAAIRAICCVLALKGAWAFSVLVIVGWLWKTAIPIPAFTFWIYVGQNIASAACWGYLLATLLPQRKH